MQAKVFCKTVAKGRQAFYLNANGKDYFLFEQDLFIFLWHTAWYSLKNGVYYVYCNFNDWERPLFWKKSGFNISLFGSCNHNTQKIYIAILWWTGHRLSLRDHRHCDHSEWIPFVLWCSKWMWVGRMRFEFPGKCSLP